MSFFSNLFSKGSDADNSGMFLAEPAKYPPMPPYKVTQMNYITLIPTIIDLIKSVEILLPASSGKEKLDAVLTAITTLVGEVTDLAPKLTPLISAIVKGLNVLGIFSRKPAPVAVPV